MDTYYSAVPSLSHRIEQNLEADDFTIDVRAEVFQPGFTGSPLSLERSFSPDEFIYEDDESPGKEELSYFLIDSGIEGFDAQYMMIDLILYACEVVNSIHNGFKGVVSLTLTVRFLPEEVNRAGSRPNPGLGWRTGGEDWERFFIPVELKPVVGPAVKSRDGATKKDGGRF
ncbi:PREDICTED: uncharacterized protein LOC104798872 [Tarenaya hassleriana]|uniref:uncharacterized protein LOC104798872 n=1 Tax=Tarenaya hassleriana TaxID=28532 RepID=UPI00053C89EF|nr:PREDICTED: uncharacterized protein LOC104798872 [Tarenaya hassleriana]